LLTWGALGLMRLPALAWPVLARRPAALQKLLTANQGLGSAERALMELALQAPRAHVEDWLGRPLPTGGA